MLKGIIAPKVILFTWFGRMFRIVKDQHITGGSLCGNDTRVLRHVASTIYFPFMIYFYFDFDFSTNRTKSTKFCKRNRLNRKDLHCQYIKPNR